MCTCNKLLALVTACALAPVLAWCALRIKLDSPGAVLFLQERVGRGTISLDYDNDGDLDLVLKFRTSPQVRLMRNEIGSERDYWNAAAHKSQWETLGSRRAFKPILVPSAGNSSALSARRPDRIAC